MPIINGRGRVGIRRPSVAAIPSIVSDGLKMYLNAGNATSYAGTGTAWTDLSGNGNGGTLVGGAVYSSASGGSISFDGGNDYANLGAAAYFNGLTDMTVNLWVLPQTSAAGRFIFSRYNYNSNSNGFLVWHNTDNKFYFDGRESNAQYFRVGTLNTYAVDSWHNVTVTKSGNSWKIYINGVLENSATLGLGNVAWLAQASAQIGGIIEASGGSQVYGKSNVAVAMAYSRALTAAEVLQNYDALKLRFVPLTYSIVSDGLALHLDAGNAKSYYGTGTVWKDLSGNSNSGALTNGPIYNPNNGGSIVLDGTNDCVIISTSAAINNHAGDLTINIWVYMDANLAGKINAIAHKRYAGDYVTPFNLIYEDRPGVGQKKIYLLVGGGGTIMNIVGSDNNFDGVYNKWINIAATISGTSIKLYINSVNTDTGTFTGTRNTNTYPIKLGSDYTPGTYNFSANCKIANFNFYTRALSGAEIAQNFDALKPRFYPIVSDADAQSFVVSAGLTSSTQASAINTLVTSLKAAGVWAKMKAVYPFVGGSAASHKWNLKDPRDLDAAYRLAFTAGWIHSSTGAKPNGTSDYADTFLIPNTAMSTGGDHLSFYSRTNGSSDVDYLISAQSNSPSVSFLGLVGKRNSTLGADGRGLYVTSNPTSTYENASFVNTSRDTRGFFVGMSEGANTYYIFNNTVFATNTTISTRTSRLTSKLYISAFPIDGVVNSLGYSNKECAFASIGNGLTTAEASSLYTAVQAFQTALGRQV